MMSSACRIVLSSRMALLLLLVELGAARMVAALRQLSKFVVK